MERSGGEYTRMKVTELIKKCRTGEKKFLAAFVKHYFNYVYFLVEKWLTPSLIDEETIQNLTASIFKAIARDKLARLTDYDGEA